MGSWKKARDKESLSRYPGEVQDRNALYNQDRGRTFTTHPLLAYRNSLACAAFRAGPVE